MTDIEFAQKTNLQTAHNLVRQAHRHLCVGDSEEARAMCRLADEFLSRAESPACEVLPFPKVPR